MAKGKALNIGLNSVNSDSYAGWDGTLNAPENDAVDLTSLANSQGFDVIKLVTTEATYENVIEQIKNSHTASILQIEFPSHICNPLTY